MNDHNRLNDRLAKLSTLQTGEISGVRMLQGDDLRQVILQEVDETILARVLSFENGENATIGLEVANRRILRFIQLAPPEETATDGPFIDQPISEANGPEANQFQEFLQEFVSGSETLRVRSGKMTRVSDASEIGCSAIALAKAWGIGLNGEQPEIAAPSIEAIVIYCQKMSLAWVRHNQESAPEFSGDEKDVEHLTKVLEYDLSKLNSVLDSCINVKKPATCVMLTGPDAKSQAVALVQLSGDRACFLVHKDQIPDIANKWR